MISAGEFEAHRPRLTGIAYRMLGDVASAEDVVQEAFLRWSAKPEGEAREPSAYLTTVVTRLAIDRLRSAQARRETYVGPWLAEPVLYDSVEPQPGPDDMVALAESVTLGFLRILDLLTPLERATFLLHDVFDCGFDEIAGMLDKTDSACRKTASRARAKIAAHRDDPKRRATSHEEQVLVAAFGAALASADFDRIQALLTSDVVATSDGGGVRYAAVRPVVGRYRTARFLAGIAKKAPPDTVFEVATVNGEPAFIVFIEGELDVVLVMGTTSEGISHLHAVRNPDKLAALASGYRLPG